MNDVVAVGSVDNSDKKIHIFNLTSGVKLRSLSNHTQGIPGLKLLNSRILVSWSTDNKIKLWVLVNYIKH